MFVTPNMINDGHDSNIETSATFLKGFLEPKLTDPAYKHTLFFITFDESGSNKLTMLFDRNNHIYSLLIGAGVEKVNKEDNRKFDHYSWLATVERIFQLGELGAKDKYAATFDLMYPTGNSTFSYSVKSSSAQYSE
jgi:acid phosphatase